MSIVTPVLAMLAPALFPVLGNAGTFIGLVAASAGAVTAIVLGILALSATRGGTMGLRVAAVIGMLLGAIQLLVYAFILFVMMTPNAPF